MTQTIFEIAQEVCDRVTVNVPSTLFDTNDRIARILRTAAKDITRDIMRDGMRNGLTAFQSQWVFATRPGVYAYQLPPDFYRMIPRTEHYGASPIGVLGPVSPQTWSGWTAGAAATIIPMGWRIKNNLIHLASTPTKEEIVVIEYLSRYSVARDATNADLLPVSGRLVPISPLVPIDGYIAPDAADVLEKTISSASDWGQAYWGSAVWGNTARDILHRIPVSTSNTRFPAFKVRAETFTDDNDTSAFQDTHVLSLGLTYMLRKGLQMPYLDDFNEYETEKETMLAHDGGAMRTINIGGETINEVEPIGNGRWLVS